MRALVLAAGRGSRMGPSTAEIPKGLVPLHGRPLLAWQMDTLRAAGIDADADLRNEKISYKVREHSVAKVPVLLAVGQREVADETVAVRRLGNKQQQVLGVADAIDQLSDEIRLRGRAA